MPENNLELEFTLGRPINSIDEAVEFLAELSKMAGCPLEMIKNLRFINKEGKPVYVDTCDLFSSIQMYVSPEQVDKATSEARQMFKSQKVSLTDAVTLILDYGPISQAETVPKKYYH